jgi:hypothetical protein
MADHQDTWNGPATPPPGWIPPQPPVGAPVFRPIWREAFPITAGPLLAGLGGGVLWLFLVGFLARDLRGYAWLTVLAGLTAWGVVVLAKLGDRGAAVGVAISTAFGLSAAAIAVAVRWSTTGDWPMW